METKFFSKQEVQVSDHKQVQPKIYRVSDGSEVSGGISSCIPGYIYYTKNYSAFKKQLGNRAIKQGGLKKLEKNVKEKGPKFHLNPIQINRQGEILDGQHRKEVAEKLEHEIYFMVGDGDLSDTQAINLPAAGKWDADDYMDSYIQKGYEVYKTYKEFQRQFGFGHNICQVILMNVRGIGTVSPLFKEGGLFIYDYEKAVTKAEMLKSLTKILKSNPEVSRVSDKREFQYALLDLFEHPKFDLTRLIKKMQIFLQARGPYSLTTCPNREKSFKERLLEIYNYKAGHKEKMNLID